MKLVVYKDRLEIVTETHQDLAYLDSIGFPGGGKYDPEDHGVLSVGYGWHSDRAPNEARTLCLGRRCKPKGTGYEG